MEPHVNQTQTANTPQTGVEARLAALEQLLREQRDLAAKTKWHKSVQSVLLLAMVLVLGAGMFTLNYTLSARTAELPTLIHNANLSAEQVQTTMQDISSVDFKGLNSAITDIKDGVSAVDFETLSKSIQELQTVTEGLAKVVNFFG